MSPAGPPPTLGYSCLYLFSSWKFSSLFWLLKSLDTACITDHSGKENGVFRDLSERTWGQAAAAVGRSLSRIPPPLLCMQIRSHGSTELISLHLQLGSSQTRGDQNTSNILGDNVPPVSGSPTVLLLQRAGGCLLREKQDEARGAGGGAEGRACSLFLSLPSVLGQYYLVERTAMMKVFCICTVQHSSSRRVPVGHWKSEETNWGPLGICSFK